jgi:hypothetical protein
MFISTECDEETHQEMRPQANGRQADVSSGCGKTVAISIPFLWSTAFLFIFIRGWGSRGRKNLTGFGPIFVLSNDIILASLNLVRQSL